MSLRVPSWSAAAAGALLVAACSSSSTQPPPNDGPPVYRATVPLDPEGVVQSTITVTHPLGSRLTVHAGTRITLVGVAGGAGVVAVGLSAAAGSPVTLPAGITPVSQVGVTVTAGGVARQAVFSPAAGVDPQASVTATAPASGVDLVIPADASDGALGLLFDVGSGRPVRIETAIPRPAAGAGALTSGSNAQVAAAVAGATLSFPLGGTTSAAAGTTAGSTSASAAPSGGYWTTFAIQDPGCLDVGGSQLCGPYRASMVTIVEESTAEILGVCTFGGANVVSTPSYPPGYSFSCERTQGASGETTALRISSSQVANVPLLKVNLVDPATGQPRWEIYARPTGGVHTPSGGELADPYSDRNLKFAVAKTFTFETKDRTKDYAWMRRHTVDPLVSAGYQAALKRFWTTSTGIAARVDVYDTLVGRVVMEDVLTGEGWKVRAADTKGNAGAYDYTERSYQGTFTAKMVMPIVNATVWEITGDVTFKKYEVPPYPDTGYDWYYPASGTATQTSYTVPGNVACYGEPPSFTDTFTLGLGTSYLWILTGSDPARYGGSGDTSTSAGIVASHPYKECCPMNELMGQPLCADKTLDVYANPWMRTGETDRTGAVDGVLGGTYQTQNGPSYEWSLAPVTQ